MLRIWWLTCVNQDMFTNQRNKCYSTQSWFSNLPSSGHTGPTDASKIYMTISQGNGLNENALLFTVIFDIRTPVLSEFPYYFSVTTDAIPCMSENIEYQTCVWPIIEYVLYLNRNNRVLLWIVSNLKLNTCTDRFFTSTCHLIGHI